MVSSTPAGVAVVVMVASTPCCVAVVVVMVSSTPCVVAVAVVMISSTPSGVAVVVVMVSSTPGGVVVVVVMVSSTPCGVAVAVVMVSSTPCCVAVVVVMVSSTPCCVAVVVVMVSSTPCVVAVAVVMISSTPSGVAVVVVMISSTPSGVAVVVVMVSSTPGGVVVVVVMVSSTPCGVAVAVVMISSTPSGVAVVVVMISSTPSGVAVVVVMVSSTHNPLLVPCRSHEVDHSASATDNVSALGVAGLSCAVAKQAGPCRPASLGHDGHASLVASPGAHSDSPPLSSPSQASEVFQAGSAGLASTELDIAVASDDLPLPFAAFDEVHEFCTLEGKPRWKRHDFIRAALDFARLPGTPLARFLKYEIVSLPSPQVVLTLDHGAIPHRGIVFDLQPLGGRICTLDVTPDATVADALITLQSRFAHVAAGYALEGILGGTCVCHINGRIVNAWTALSHAADVAQFFPLSDAPSWGEAADVLEGQAQGATSFASPSVEAALPTPVSQSAAPPQGPGQGEASQNAVVARSGLSDPSLPSFYTCFNYLEQRTLRRKDY